MNFIPEMLRLYAVTDRTWTGKQTLAEQVEEALKGGVTCVQLREKHLAEKEFLQEAIILKEICHRYHVPLFINDNVSVALKADADGVHLGQKDMSAAEARKILGKNKIIGVTAKTIEQAMQAQEQGANYLGTGAMFPTSTKTDTVVIDRTLFRKICLTVNIPVVAIGGITEENLPELSGLPMEGIALVSAIFSAERIEETCRRLKNLSENLISGKGANA